MATSDALLPHITEMQTVERELDSQLSTLGSTVDQGFCQLQSLNRAGMSIARQIALRGHPRYAMSAMGLTFAITGLVGMFNGISAARAHNRGLKKLLEQKKKIAREKIHSLQKIKVIAKHNESSLRMLFYKEIDQEYTVRDILAKRKSRKLLTENILKVVDIYRLSLFNMYMVDFILAEYRAWLEGNQRSNKKQPIMSFVNTDIFHRIFDDNAHNKPEDVLYCNQSQISGGEICFLADSSLTSVMLSETKFKHSEALPPMRKPASKVAKKLMKHNPCIGLYRNSRRKLIFFCEWPFKLVLGVVFFSLFGFLEVECYNWWAEWHWLLKWLALIVAGIIEFVVVLLTLAVYFAKLDDMRPKICKKARMAQMKLSGYVEIYEPDLSRHSLILAGGKGLLKSIFSIFE